MGGCRRLLAIPVLIVALCAALEGGATRAGPKAPAPRTAPPVRPTIVFSESYFEDDEVSVGRCVIDAKIPLDPADVATFDGDTLFNIEVGEFNLTELLSDDPDYAPGATSATFREVSDYDEFDRPIVGLVARIRWTPTCLVVHIVARVGEDWTPVISDQYAGEDSGPIDLDPDLYPGADIMFGGADVSWEDVPFSGRVRSWTRHGEDFTSVRTHGRATQ